MPHVLETKRIILRSVNDQDSPLLSAWENAEDYLEFVSSQKGTKCFFQFIIELRKNKKPVGVLYTFSYNKSDGYMFLNVFLDKDCRKVGYGVEACSLAICYIFDSLSVYKIYCDAYSSNYKCISMMKGMGLEQEGLLKGHRLYKGKRYDVIRFAVYRQNLQRINGFLQRLNKR